MRYFDSREEAVGLDHVLASGALPPAFPAVRIDGDPYWDGGIYSNTPIEAVLDDKPRQDSVIFTVHMWNPEGPGTGIAVAGHGAAEGHPIREPREEPHRAAEADPPPAPRHPRAGEGAARGKRATAKAKELASWGCGTTMHVARLVAPSIDREDHTKDIDFTPAGIRARWQAGYADTKRMLERAPWTEPVDPIDGVVIHDVAGTVAPKLAQGVDGFAGRTR